MKDFFKMLAASLIGCGIVLFFGLFILIGIFSAALSFSSSQVAVVPSNAILQLNFEKPVLEQGAQNPFAQFSPMKLLSAGNDGYGYYDIVEAIERAATDSRISMIYLNLNYLNAGISHIDEIRDALIRFRTSGKPVISYADAYGQAGYYLASVSDKVYLNPEGLLNLKGFALNTLYYKALFDELGVEAQFIKHGKYKSGVDQFVQRQMNPEDREQTQRYIQSVWGHWISGISNARGLSEERLNAAATREGFSSASEALDQGFVDGIFYKDEMIDQLCKLQGVSKESELKPVGMGTYISAALPSRSKQKIALVYADGIIYTGKGRSDIMTDNYLPLLRELRTDSTVKAVVLRINSPGGDAMAAAMIHREIQLLSQQKPVVVSMGDASASGGYWIASAGSYIFSNPASLTGSIGAYTMAYNGQKGMNKWLKLNAETVKTHPSSDAGSIYRPLSAVELQRLQQSIDKTYSQFVETVAQGRSLPQEEVEKVAQGRIWSGSDAVQAQLVDRLGGLYEAIQYAAEQAELYDYRLVNYPVKGSVLEQFLQGMSSKTQTLGGTEAVFTISDPQSWTKALQQWVEKELGKGVQAKLPYTYEISY